MTMLRKSLRDKYDPIGKIGEGTYGLVYKAQVIAEGEVAVAKRSVAVKKFKSFRSGDGISPTAIREIKLLRELSHDYIVDLMDVMLDPDDKALYLVFDYADHDLLEMIRSNHAHQGAGMDPVTVKSLLWQILQGINYLHKNWVIHRDLKPSNILVTGSDKPVEEQGCVKIADFGLARLFQAPLRPFTDVDSVVVTIWYRAPELLLGAKHYTKAVDIWAIGCIFAELITSKPLFQGQEKIRKGEDRNPFQSDQVSQIFRILGKPTQKEWPGIVDLQHWNEAQNWRESKNILHERVPALRPGTSGFDLLSKLLEYDPSKRITAEQALEHEFFREEPLPKRCALVNGDPYKPRPVTPLDPNKDTGWATKVKKNGNRGAKSSANLSSNLSSNLLEGKYAKASKKLKTNH
ncbi:hypothetical protein NDN08_001454 [Rhodosorus marinus]|uniref:Protein kinase domain-containing protein n=1 Tax=Rhodosorus marinus TaxID=101924 RepID=A0AAV8UQX9_9RHOD|nr:hypothetical protein NDN08_001454 [Rhodosorus marinus]